jgi:hypothetical protein
MNTDPRLNLKATTPKTTEETLQELVSRIKEKIRQANLPTCSICQLPYEGHGNNAWPINDGRCCDDCNWSTVIQARIRSIKAA